MRAILMYHSIDPSGSPVSLPREAFEDHVRFLAAGGVRVVDVPGCIRPDRQDTLALTFDDAFANFETEAWPLLREARLPVTLFVVTGRAGATNDWSDGRGSGVPAIPLMDWDALGRVAEEGVELGLHSKSHPHLVARSEAELAEEVEAAGEELERRTGVRARVFAYPYGSFDEATARYVGARFQHAVTTELRWLEDAEDPHRLPRLDAWYLRRPGALATFGGPGFRAGVRLRRLARGLKAGLARRLGPRR